MRATEHGAANPGWWIPGPTDQFFGFLGRLDHLEHQAHRANIKQLRDSRIRLLRRPHDRHQADAAAVGKLASHLGHGEATVLHVIEREIGAGRHQRGG